MDTLLAQAIKRAIQDSIKRTEEVLNNKTESADYAYGYLKGLLNIIVEELDKVEQLNK